MWGLRCLIRIEEGLGTRACRIGKGEGEGKLSSNGKGKERLPDWAKAPPLFLPDTQRRGVGFCSSRSVGALVGNVFE